MRKYLERKGLDLDLLIKKHKKKELKKIN